MQLYLRYSQLPGIQTTAVSALCLVASLRRPAGQEYSWGINVPVPAVAVPPCLAVGTIRSNTECLGLHVQQHAQVARPIWGLRSIVCMDCLVAVAPGHLCTVPRQGCCWLPSHRGGCAHHSLPRSTSGGPAHGGNLRVHRSSSVGDVHSNNSGASAHAAPRSARTAASAPRPKDDRGSEGNDSGTAADRDAAAPASHSQPATSDRSMPQSDGDASQSDVRAGPPPEQPAAGEAVVQEEAAAAEHPCDGGAAAEPEAAAVEAAAADTPPPEAGQRAKPAEVARAASDQASETAASGVEEAAVAQEETEDEAGAASEALPAEPRAEEGSPSSSCGHLPGGRRPGVCGQREGGGGRRFCHCGAGSAGGPGHAQHARPGQECQPPGASPTPASSWGSVCDEM